MIIVVVNIIFCAIIHRGIVIVANIAMTRFYTKVIDIVIVGVDIKYFIHLPCCTPSPEVS